MLKMAFLKGTAELAGSKYCIPPPAKQMGPAPPWQSDQTVGWEVSRAAARCSCSPGFSPPTRRLCISYGFWPESSRPLARTLGFLKNSCQNKSGGSTSRLPCTLDVAAWLHAPVSALAPWMPQAGSLGTNIGVAANVLNNQFRKNTDRAMVTQSTEALSN